MITVLDYDAGNIKSVEKALDFLGEEVKITRDREEILSADGVILPGVGAFGDAMEKLHQYGLVDVIHEVVDRQIPFLGICLGLQLMFGSSEETPGVEGLHLLDGKIRRIPAAEELKIPHIGWNDLTFPNEGRLFRGVEEHHPERLCIENTRTLMLEMPFSEWTDQQTEAVTVLALDLHFNVVLVHPERFCFSSNNRRRLKELASLPIALQVNADTLLHWRSRKQGLELLELTSTPIRRAARRI